MAKIGDFEAAGVSGNIFKPTDWLKVILGVGVILASISLVQRAGAKVQGVTGGWVDTTPNPLFETPVITTPKRTDIIFQ